MQSLIYSHQCLRNGFAEPSNNGYTDWLDNTFDRLAEAVSIHNLNLAVNSFLFDITWAVLEVGSDINLVFDSLESQSNHIPTRAFWTTIYTHPQATSYWLIHSSIQQWNASNMARNPRDRHLAKISKQESSHPSTQRSWFNPSNHPWRQSKHGARVHKPHRFNPVIGQISSSSHIQVSSVTRCYWVLWVMVILIELPAQSVSPLRRVLNIFKI